MRRPPCPPILGEEVGEGFSWFSPAHERDALPVSQSSPRIGGQGGRILMLVTEPHQNLNAIVSEAVAGGVDIVQWRDKSAGASALPSTLRQAAWPARVIANAPGEIAARLGVDGRHLPESCSETVEDTRRTLCKNALVGRSAHCLETAVAAEGEGADYVVVGTIFASRSHPDLTPAGLDFLRAVCQAVSIPVIAIGGILPENVADCLSAGAAGVAVLSPIMLADNPRAATAAYRAALDEADGKKH
ncbi:MAG: thiamine-phosphate diphosphorylase [Capsulimonas sp.]|nr:thiamine-phosphate diphosphorylase [Capsulimonas sp.]